MTGTDAGEADWDPDRYDGEHGFVAAYGEEVLEWLSPAPDERILDLGCGTGHLTAEIAAAGADVVGIDRSAAMLETARADHPGLPLVRADARRFAVATSFDAVFTNAALHWVDDPDAVFASVARALRPGGRFVGEFGGAGNVAAIEGAVADELASRGYPSTSPWYFPTVGEFASRLEAHDFEVRRVALFDRPTPLEGGENGLRNWLAMFGTPLLGPVPDAERDAVLDAVEARLRPERYEAGRWVADYRRLRFVTVRS